MSKIDQCDIVITGASETLKPFFLMDTDNDKTCDPKHQVFPLK